MDLHDAIYGRRDIRHFRPDPVPDEILRRMLDAAHHAGSVGFMQPWNFIVLRSPEVRRRVFDIFQAENDKAAARYSAERRNLYDSLKLQGILDAPLNLTVTCDRNRRGPDVLGRSTIRDTDIYSTCCAVQNFWLAGRAEGVGVGWVSILDADAIAGILGLPDGVVLVAYLCVGYPVEFGDRPMLERVGWEARTPLEELVFEDGWGRSSRIFRGSGACQADEDPSNSSADSTRALEQNDHQTMNLKQIGEQASDMSPRTTKTWP